MLLKVKLAKKKIIFTVKLLVFFGIRNALSVTIFTYD